MKQLDIKMIIATLIAGIAAAVLDTFLYSILKGVLPEMILIPILILVLAVIVVVTIMIVAEVTNNTDDSFLFLEGKGMIIVGVVVSLAVAGLLGGLFQMIYETEMEKSNGVTSYVFLLDESGSMEVNDEYCQRYDAVQSLMETMDKDFTYAAYVFADNCFQIRDMLPVAAGTLVRPADVRERAGELTYMGAALEYVLQDIQSGVIDVGERPQVILLTDGIANDMETFMGSITDGREIIDKYADAGIVISTVGLSENVSDDMLNEIATKTNGTYVQVDHAAQLAQGFSSVAITAKDRDLLSDRNMAEGNLLYGAMRVLFLTIIGVVVAFIRAMSAANSDNTGLILIVGAISALVGALLMEIGTAIGLPAFIFRILYLVLIAVTPIEAKIITGSTATNVIHGYQDVIRLR